MGGKTFAVSSFSDVQKTATKLREISASYTNIYTQLMEAASTIGAAYEGSDNLDFVNQITGFTEELRAMAEKLKTDAEILDKQMQNYTSKIDENSMTVKKMAN